MTLQDSTGDNPAAPRKRKRFDKTAPVDPSEALEGLLINAHRVATTLGELGIFRDSEVSVAEWAVLKSLGDRQNVPLKEVSRAAGVSRQRFRKLVSELEAKGLVSTSRAKADDKRTRMISATPMAAKALSLISQKMQSLFPETGKGNRSRSLVGAAHAMERVTRAMRRSSTPRKGKRDASQAVADDDDD